MKSDSAIFLRQSIKDYRFWIKLILGLSQILSITIFIIYTYFRLARNWQVTEYLVPGFYSIWINLSYFTTITNLLCGIFFLHSALYHHLEGKTNFNNDAVAKAIIVSLTLGLLLYHFSEFIKFNPYRFNYFVDWVSFIFEHSLGPIVAILYYIFLYNHENIKEWKSFSQKYFWLILLLPVCYGIFFWIFGELSRIGGGLGLYYWNGATVFGQGSHFPYPFLDFYHKPLFIKNISGAGEAIVMLVVIFLFLIVFSYLYSWAAISVRNHQWQNKLFVKIRE